MIPGKNSHTTESQEKIGHIIGKIGHQTQKELGCHAVNTLTDE